MRRRFSGVPGTGARSRTSTKSQHRRGEFLPPQEQSNSEDDLIGDQDRPRRPLDKSLLNKGLLARWIRRRRAALRRAIAERKAAKARHHDGEQAERLGREALTVALQGFEGGRVHLEKCSESGVASVILDYPERKNALSGEKMSNSIFRDFLTFFLSFHNFSMTDFFVYRNTAQFPAPVFFRMDDGISSSSLEHL